MLDIKSKVADIISRNIPAGASVGVAVSGGSDSMCLISIILETGIIPLDKLSVINIEHGIRGEESLRDSAFVAEYCASHRLSLHYKSYDVPAMALASSRSIETEARLARKSFFDELIQSKSIDYVLLAHNASDQTETVLMHIFRGSGINGLRGMGELDGRLCRPLLTSSKEEILAYCAENGVQYVLDSTNLDSDYTRNYLRNEVIPVIKNKWPALDDAVSKLSKSAQEVEADGFTGILLPVEKLSGTNVIRLFNNAGLKVDYEKKHVDAVISLAASSTGQGVDLPHGYRAVKEYGCIAVYRKEERVGGAIPFGTGEFTVNGVRCAETNAAPEVNKEGTTLDPDKVPAGAVYRNRKSGDRFTPVGGKGRLLSDYLTDKKIPLRLRDKLVLLASGKEIYAIVSLAVGEKAKIDGNTVRAVKVTARLEE